MQESLRAQRNQGGIAVSLRSDSAHSGEIPLPTAVGIGMTCRGRGNAGSVKARSGFVVYCGRVLWSCTVVVYCGTTHLLVGSA